MRRRVPLLPRAAAHVAHAAIRNRGTLGGSLAYADPAAELPACAVALDATIVVASASGERMIKAEDFFTGLMETRRAGELIVAVRIPVPATTSVMPSENSPPPRRFRGRWYCGCGRMERDLITSARVVYFGCVDRAKVAHKYRQHCAACRLPIPDPGGVIGAVEAISTPTTCPAGGPVRGCDLARVLTRRAIGEMEAIANVAYMTKTGDELVEIEATINGVPLRARVKARQHLADFLRQELELTGTHLGLRTRRLRRLYGLDRRRNLPRLPGPSGTSRWQEGRYD